ncbi:uncharacterized protein LAESUDRAFT_647207 [Laetiporus sulphureus 93-53]|uniref:Nucleoside diphosphate kinase n=1 Tax=Laetiporus sulphureus 93-53 TaxID=1314785 RepID=A0A165FKR2_9APHY|nr:uncharacterized protein LAESUDRAFT_647207 [Laetiporus sulphureus 93-53]KZT09119.1 hypothetical protein LAESUDRAFT_647207 [Laetiporus sulphureus 93-53]
MSQIYIAESPVQSTLQSPPSLQQENTAFPPGEVELPSSPTPLPTSPSTATSRTTRTVAIIKHHALEHRFDIEQRISEAGFEIVKERQMEFDVETDPETLFELFGADYESFGEGPVWVYVLERRRAVEVWATLMGNADPAIACKQTPHSLRALYGSNAKHNAVMGSPDVPTAEMQIMAVFASSPPFPPTDLPDTSFNSDTMRSPSSSILSSLRKTTSSDGDPASSVTSPSTAGGSKTGKSPFKARPLPPSHTTPTIVPRMSRAASLRAGLPVEKTPTVHMPPSKERLAQTFENVPGHKRRETITVASTAPPAIAPRMTRAASLRLGITPPEKTRKSLPAYIGNGGDGQGEKKDPFEGVPGHKRRESIPVASTKPPTMSPRTNRSATLRQMKESAPPPSSFTLRTRSEQPPSRSQSRNSLDQSTARSTVTRPASAASAQSPASRPTPSRAASRTSATAATSRKSTSESRASVSAKPAAADSASAQRSKVVGTTDGAAEPAAAKPKARVSSTQAPTIVPRTNKSAALRAAKMASASATATAVPSVAKAKPAHAPRAIRA